MLEEKLPSEKNDEEESVANLLTEEEVAVYDRQIRLWGVESQKRLRKSRILVAGINGLGNEVCKNVILSGVQHMTILDDKTMTKDDCRSQFLAKPSSVGQNKASASFQRLHELNPMVDLVVDTEQITDKPESFFQGFDIVCLIGLPRETQVKVDEICHRNNIKFLCGSVHGYYGYMFSDLGNHTYVEEKIKIDKVSVKMSDEPAHKKQKIDSKASEDTKEMTEKVAKFKKLSSSLSHDALQNLSLKQLKSTSKAYFVMQVVFEFYNKNNRYPDVEHKMQDWKKLLEVRDSVLEKLKVDNDLLPDHFVSNCIGEITPVSCIVGGILGQEIIKAISGRDAPHNNFFFYDGIETTGLVDCIGNL